MVDAERLHRLLRRVSEDVSTLKGYARRGDSLNEPAVLGHIKYAFVTAIEASIDAAQHICASEGWGPPDTNADAFEVLSRHGVMDGALAQRMMTAARFRNLLVHGYARADDARVIAALDDLGDFDSFVAALSQLI